MPFKLTFALLVSVVFCTISALGREADKTSYPNRGLVAYAISSYDQQEAGAVTSTSLRMFNWTAGYRFGKKVKHFNEIGFENVAFNRGKIKREVSLSNGTIEEVEDKGFELATRVMLSKHFRLGLFSVNSRFSSFLGGGISPSIGINNSVRGGTTGSTTTRVSGGIEASVMPRLQYKAGKTLRFELLPIYSPVRWRASRFVTTDPMILLADRNQSNTDFQSFPSRFELRLGAVVNF